MFAYKLSPSQAHEMKQLPDWVSAERYDVVAKTENHNATKDDLRAMMRSLLAERFKLALHRETQQVPVYALVLAKQRMLGPKLVPHPADEPCDSAAGATAGVTAGGFPTACGGIQNVPASAPELIALGARNVPLSLLAGALTNVASLGLPVLDATGLAGKYDFRLEFSQERRPVPDHDGAPPDNAGPGIEQALRQQLGLALKSQKGPVDVWVVDHLEPATAN